MTNNEKIRLIEEMLEREEGTINESTELTDISEWDSMAVLSLIVLMDEKFNKKLTGAKIKEFKSIKDVIDYMEQGII